LYVFFAASDRYTHAGFFGPSEDFALFYLTAKNGKTIFRN